MNKTLKVGVFGVGSLGEHHARIYAGIPEAELVGIYDVNPARAAEIASRYGTRVCTSSEELAADIEAASIAVPTDRHHAMASELLARGIHLLIEKPIAATTSEAEDLVRLAAQEDLILQVGHVERFNPVMTFLEQRITQPRFIEASRLSTYPPPRDGGPPRGTEVSVVLDLMIHDIEIILHIVRSPLREIHAVGVPVLSTTEDIANVRLVFESGCVANVTASRISLERLRKIRVFQPDAYVSLDYMNQTGQIIMRTPAGLQPDTVPIEKAEPLDAELRAFVNCVMHRNDPVVTGRHASDALRLAVEICRHMRESPS